MNQNRVINEYVNAYIIDYVKSYIMEMHCKRCGYSWSSKSIKHRICCPGCKTSLTQRNIVRNVHDTEVYFPVALLDKHHWTKAVGWAKSNQEPFIKMSFEKGSEVLTLS